MVEEVRAVRILVEQASLGRGHIAQFGVAACARVGVACDEGGAIGNAFERTIGGDNRHTLVRTIIVHAVFHPRIRVEVHVEHEETMSVAVGIACYLLTILQEIVFVAVALIIYNVGFGLAGQRFHILDGGRVFQFGRSEPSAVHALVTGVLPRHFAVLRWSVEAAVVHQVPAVHAKIVVAARVIEVGDGHAVAKLVAGCADAIDDAAAGAAKFVGSGVGIYVNAVHRDDAIAIAYLHSGREHPFVGPNGVGVCPACFTVACIDDIDLVHLAIVVPVVLCEIYTCLVGQMDSLAHHLGRVQVVAVGVVAAVVRHVLADSHGTHHIEGEVKLSITTSVKIVVDAKFHTVLVVAHLVEIVVEIGLRVLHRQVGKVHKDDEALFLTADRIGGSAQGGTAFLPAHHAGPVGSSAALLAQGEALLAERGIATVGLCYVAVARGIGIIMQILVTAKGGSNLATVRKGNGALDALGRNRQ